MGELERCDAGSAAASIFGDDSGGSTSSELSCWDGGAVEVASTAPPPVGSPVSAADSCAAFPEVAADVEREVASIPVGVCGALEGATGAPLDAVELHTGAEARAITAAHDARALTIGNAIYFDDGELDPASADGRSLLAHEVAHTVQQSGSPAAGAASDPEREADGFAEAFVRGETAAPLQAAPRAPAGAKRKGHHKGARLEANPEAVELEAEIGGAAPFAMVFVRNPGDRPVTIKRVIHKIMPVGGAIRPFGDYQVDGIPPGTVVPANGAAQLVVHFHPQHQRDEDATRTTRRPARISILDAAGQPAASIDLGGTARPRGGAGASARKPERARPPGALGKQPFDERAGRYEGAIEAAANDGDRQRALARAYASWSSYMTADELEGYEESHPGFDLERARHRTYYGAASDDRRDALDLPTSSDRADVPNIGQGADGNPYSYTERGAAMGAEQMLHGASDPMRLLVTAYALSMVVAPFETGLAQAIVDTGQCATGYDVSGDELSDEQRGAKCEGLPLEWLFVAAAGAPEGAAGKSGRRPPMPEEGPVPRPRETRPPEGRPQSPIDAAEVQRRHNLGHDPATGKFRENEAGTAVRVEGNEGIKLERFEPPNPNPEKVKGDWIDPATGTIYDGCSPGPTKHFDKAWPSFQKSLQDHATHPTVDKVVVDIAGLDLTSAQKQQLLAELGKYPPEKIVMLGF